MVLVAPDSSVLPTPRLVIVGNDLSYDAFVATAKAAYRGRSSPEVIHCKTFENAAFAQREDHPTTYVVGFERNQSLSDLVASLHPLANAGATSIIIWSGRIFNSSKTVLKHDRGVMTIPLMPKNGPSEDFREYLRSLRP